MTNKNITKSLKENIEIFQKILDYVSDLRIRILKIGSRPYIDGAILYIDGIADTEKIQEYLVVPLLSLNSANDDEAFIDEIAYHHIKTADVEVVESFQPLIDGVLLGKAVILLDQNTKGIITETAQWKERHVAEAVNEKVYRGPLIGCSEKLKTNLNLIRSLVKTPKLCIRSMKVGILSKTDVSIVYIREIATEKNVTEVMNRIQRINVKYLLEARIIEDYIEGKRKTFFPLTLSTERPDSIAAALYEGRIAILVDGTPEAIIVPTVFWQFFQTPDDYYGKFGRFITRPLRFLCFLTTIYLPGLYTAIMRFHKDVLPDHDLKSSLLSHTLIPIWAEVLILLILLHLINEASFRLPKSTVFSLSILGTIIVGDAALSSKLVHPLSLFIVGVCFITGYPLLIRGFLSTVISLRFLLFIIGSFFGLSCLGIVSLLLIIYAASLKSLGVPYLAPLIPLNPNEWKDTFYRGNLDDITNSPHTFPSKEKKE